MMFLLLTNILLVFIMYITYILLFMSRPVLLNSVSFDDNCEHPYYYDVKYHYQKAIILADEPQFNPLPPNISTYNLLTIHYTVFSRSAGGRRFRRLLVYQAPATHVKQKQRKIIL